MSFPSSFRFQDEADFIRGLIVPILQRLGFSAITNYHGTREYGKDLIFGETDRFGHHTYHGLQAKYVSSISQRDAASLIDDAKEAFTMPFQHPVHGTRERISKFYVVNGGSISSNVREMFFQSLRQQYGANVRLLDGSEMEALERRALIGIESSVQMMTQILKELRSNRASMIQFTDSPYSDDALFKLGLRDDCSSEFLKTPCFESQLEVSQVRTYSDSIRGINDKRQFAAFPLLPQESKASLRTDIDGQVRAAIAIGEELDSKISVLLAGAGPLLDH